MANISNISNSLFDSILPTFGNSGNNLPRWNEDQKMFISSEYQSASGHRYYKGIRFNEKLAIVEKVGLYHTWTYIDEIEIYTFDGHSLKLAGKKSFDKQFYEKDFIREQIEIMLGNFIKGQLKIQQAITPALQIEEKVKSIVDGCYISYLSDDFGLNMQNMLPMLCANND